MLEIPVDAKTLSINWIILIKNLEKKKNLIKITVNKKIYINSILILKNYENGNDVKENINFRILKKVFS